MHSVRYAHCEGQTDVCFAENGQLIITGGEDGDVRIWRGFDDLDNTSFRVGDKVHALAHKTNRIYVGDELNEVFNLSISLFSLCVSISYIHSLTDHRLSLNMNIRPKNRYLLRNLKMSDLKKKYTYCSLQNIDFKFSC